MVLLSGIVGGRFYWHFLTFKISESNNCTPSSHQVNMFACLQAVLCSILSMHVQECMCKKSTAAVSAVSRGAESFFKVDSCHQQWNFSPVYWMGMGSPATGRTGSKSSGDHFNIWSFISKSTVYPAILRWVPCMHACMWSIFSQLLETCHMAQLHNCTQKWNRLRKKSLEMLPLSCVISNTVMHICRGNPTINMYILYSV